MYDFLMAVSEIDTQSTRAGRHHVLGLIWRLITFPTAPVQQRGLMLAMSKHYIKGKFFKVILINIVSPMPKLEMLFSSTVSMQSTKDIL